jgi:hypothetical protein
MAISQASPPGQAYSAPARTYYRDGYWTLQPLLDCSPEVGPRPDQAPRDGHPPDGEARVA